MSATAEHAERGGHGWSPDPPDRADLVVAGGGLAGMTAAWRAAAAGLETVVVDAGPERRPATRVAAGMIAPVGEASWGEERLRSAALWAAERWPEFAARLGSAAGAPVPYRRCGSLHVALDRDEAGELGRRHDLHLRLGLEAEVLVPSEARRLEPGLAPGIAAAASIPGEAEVDPRALLERLEAAALAAGARLHRGRVERVDAGSGAVALSDGTRLEPERVVLATGAWAGEGIAEGVGRLPVRPVHGELLRLRAERSRAPCERIVAGERFYVVPRDSGEVVVGATATERGFDQRVRAGGVHELLREAYRALPELAELEFVEAAAGLRPGTPDNAPLIGAMPLLDGDPSRVIAAAGLYRNGILLAPLLADGLGALLRDEPPPEPFAALTPARVAPEAAELQRSPVRGS